MKVKIRPYTSYFTVYSLFGDTLGQKLDNTWFGDIIGKLSDAIFNFQESRRVSVKIDRYDTWSMDNTLAHIILPMLKQLKETKQGSPVVDMSDVPEHLRINDPKAKAFWDDGEIDDKFHDRWAYVIDEMIWTFEQEVDGDDDSVFFTDRKLDMDKYKEYNKRKENGFRLFGKYYVNLWD